MKSRYVLGIDTSNYKTSIAVVDDQGVIISDIRRFLKVKQGEKGLRQSDALFQHVKNIPEMMEELRNEFTGTFDAIAVSTRPRPVEGSYMPVFLAGESFAKSLAAALCIPVLSFSHQEGHIEAIKAFSSLSDESRIMGCHFSGGTTELLEINTTETGYDIEIVGGTKDIAFGQVVDRAGVMLGFQFPAGEELDKIALTSESCSKVLTKIKVNDAWMNLSGIDTQTKRALESTSDYYPIIKELFIKISEAMYDMVVQCSEKTGLNNILMAGGVSSSQFMRNHLEGKLLDAGINVIFDDKGLSQDNAVGTALLGGKVIWH